MKTQTLEWNSFMKGDIVPVKSPAVVLPAIAGGILLAGKTGVALAAAPEATTGVGRLMVEMLSIGDYVAWAGLIFAGASWMFGNKTVAIERGVGVTAGYLIIRESWDYVQFLKGI
jgi:hypothetical protein